MSKDLSPRQMYAIDYKHFITTQKHIHEDIWKCNGKEIDDIRGPKIITERFPNLSIAYGRHLTLINDKDILAVFDKIEIMLEKFLQKDTFTMKSFIYLFDDIKDTQLKEILEKWYNGNLVDSDSSEDNNDAFLDLVTKYMREKPR